VSELVAFVSIQSFSAAATTSMAHVAPSARTRTGTLGSFGSIQFITSHHMEKTDAGLVASESEK